MAKQVLRAMRADDAQRAASRALRRRTAAEVHQSIIELLGANTLK
jgi:hypothetical protein